MPVFHVERTDGIPTRWPTGGENARDALDNWCRIMGSDRYRIVCPRTGKQLEPQGRGVAR